MPLASCCDAINFCLMICIRRGSGKGTSAWLCIRPLTLIWKLLDPSDVSAMSIVRGPLTNTAVVVVIRRRWSGTTHYSVGMCAKLMRGAQLGKNRSRAGILMSSPTTCGILTLALRVLCVREATRGIIAEKADGRHANCRHSSCRPLAQPTGADKCRGARLRLQKRHTFLIFVTLAQRSRETNDLGMRYTFFIAVRC